MNNPYYSWKGMMARCYHPGNHKYPRYGGRGISVCKRWHNFPCFLEDMGLRPAGATLDRIDNDANYSPENCRWASSREQNRNRSDNRMIKYDGVTKSLPEWADEYGIKRTTLKMRLDRGWPIYRALSQKVQERRHA